MTACHGPYQEWLVASRALDEARRAAEPILESMNVFPGQKLPDVRSNPAWSRFRAAQAKHWEKWQALLRCQEDDTGSHGNLAPS